MTTIRSPLGSAELLVVEDASQVGTARRAAMAFASSLGFDETRAGNVGIVATEIAGNLAKHARGGRFVVQGFEEGRRIALEMLGIDSGPGMADPERCLEDGFSTAGTPGTGLGAARRLANEFDLFSVPGQGTALVARFWSQPDDAPPASFRVGALCLPYPGERDAGDSWCVQVDGSRAVVLVVDGLGHGASANIAATRAVERFRELGSLPPGELLSRLHGPLRDTRGAAILIAEVDSERGIVTCSGVGNIAGTIVTGDQTRSLVSHSGIVGHQMVKVQEFVYPWARSSALVLASDGVKTQWRLGDQPGAFRRDPSIVASLIWRGFARGRDDATVLVIDAQT